MILSIIGKVNIFVEFNRLSFGLKGSQHYKFNYLSNNTVGIPQNGDQASGVSLKAVLDVYLENNDGIAIFKLSDVTFTEFLDRFETPADKVFLNALQQPFRVNLRGSQPFSIEYEETEERWLSNVRKGIASIFKNEILKGNFETQDEKDSISSLFHEGHLVNIFSVEEETIFGICKVTYEIHEIDEGLITPENEFFSSLKIDSNEDLWRVVRSVDFDKCNEKVILNINSLNEKRNKGQKPKYTRSSVSTYLLSGSPGHFDLRGVVVEGVMTYPLSFFDEHEAHSSTKQKLILIDQGPNEELPTLGPNLKQSTTWLYVVWSPFTQPKDSKPLPWIVYSDENVFNQPNEMYGSRPLTSDHISQLKVQILEYIETASKVLTDINYETKDSLWGTIPDSLNMVTYFFKMRLIIDAAAASGSHNAFEAIFDYISADKLKPYQIRNDYVLHVDLPENDAGAAVWLNFAHYLKEFCIHKTHNYIPVKELFNEDCALVTGRFIENLRDVIYNETLTWERTFAFLQIDTSFNILTPLFDGTNKTPKELKIMAVRVLKNSHPDRDRTQSLLRKPAMDLLKEVYSDFNQDFQVRAAALLSFISWQPSTNFWNKLAQNTWNDPSKDFSSFSSNLINLYANKKFPALEKQWKDAYSASKLAKHSTYNEDDTSHSLFNFFFKDYAKLILGVNEKILPVNEKYPLIFENNYVTFSEETERPFNEIPYNNEFFTKFLFPVFRLSKTPNTITFLLDPVNHNPVNKFCSNQEIRH
ncbi:Vitellogenin-6 [Armadillidium vulgare]|nr:Vitellogenin-6 [Armadillidium vulgare]